MRVGSEYSVYVCPLGLSSRSIHRTACSELLTSIVARRHTALTSVNIYMRELRTNQTLLSQPNNVHR